MMATVRKLLKVEILGQVVQRRLALILGLRNRKTRKTFPYSYRNLSGSFGGREIEVETQARRASLSTLFPI